MRKKHPGQNKRRRKQPELAIGVLVNPELAEQQFYSIARQYYPELIQVLTSQDLHRDCSPEQCKGTPFEFQLEGEEEHISIVLSALWELTRSRCLALAGDQRAVLDAVMLGYFQALDLGAWLTTKGLYRLRPTVTT